MNLKRWLCHLVEFGLYLVTFKPNNACLFYYWLVHSIFNTQVRCFFMKLCYNKNICYKQDSQLFTMYALSAANSLSRKSADSTNLQDEINCSTSRRLFSFEMSLCVYLSKLFQDVHTRTLTCTCFQALRIQELSITLYIKR